MFFIFSFFPEVEMSGAGDQEDGFVVKLRGLPWSVTTEDILKFFEDCEVLKNGVHLTTSREGRPSGEAYVEFENEEDLELALEKDRDHIGSRYIEGEHNWFDNFSILTLFICSFQS